MINDYEQFLESKKFLFKATGVSVDLDDINPVLFPFQRDVTQLAAKKGRCAIFADTGMGKTLMQVEWGKLIGGRALIIAPLTVVRQTVGIAKDKLGYDVHYTRSGDDLADGLNITNYQMIDKFNPDDFNSVILDESSILKSLTGATRRLLTEMFANTRYKLCCTATPAPNDLKELGNHAEFLGIMTFVEMLASFFKYSQGSGMERHEAWKLKGHVVSGGIFHRWLASWAIPLTKPSDIGYADDGYILPPLETHLTTVDAQWTPSDVTVGKKVKAIQQVMPGFHVGVANAVEAKQIRRNTVVDRAQIVADMVNNDHEQWILWCGLNNEANQLERLIPDSVQVTGTQLSEEKARLIEEWQDGKHRVLITKVKIAGMGMNLQNAHKMCFVGLDYSWESYYQAIRRCWRFGQTKPVGVHIVMSEQEMSVYNVVMRKETEAKKMINELIAHTKQYTYEELHNLVSDDWQYQTADARGEHWLAMLGDSCERMKEIPSNSIALSVYSPPFPEIFAYSPTVRDLGNSRNFREFFNHYKIIIKENLRVTMPGRICCVHIQDARAHINTDGYMGVRDLSGMVIRAYEKSGWRFWQRITINTNPQVEAVRLKHHGLLFATLQKDAAGLGGGLADYVLVFKKPGDNPTPIHNDVSQDEWIQWAHPVWNDIKETDVLPVRQAKAQDDEKHMCPLQLPVIERCVRLWSNPGEMVLSPFAGIGSEGHEAVRLGRNFTGIELKPEYWNVQLLNLKNAERQRGMDLFEWASQRSVTVSTPDDSGLEQAASE